MGEIVCPQCGSTHIMAMRGEYVKDIHASECCCHECDCFFLVSQNII